MTSIPLLRIGTRTSPLAQAQARQVRDRLAALHPALAAPGAAEIVPLSTLGDKVQDRPLMEIGGKGLFTKELDEAMLDGRIDIAVHSMKDLATVLPDGIHMAAILPREDARDAFMCLSADGLDALPPGAVVGTASLRRAAQVLHRRPDLVVRSLRGNVQTRMKRLREGHIDATLLAMAGLNRLGMAEAAASVLEPEEMLPAVGQGAIGVACRIGDEKALEWLMPLNHPETALCVEAERAFLRRLDGSCRTPIAGLAELSGDGERIRFRGLIVRPDGGVLLRAERHGPASRAVELALDAAQDLLSRGGTDFLVPPAQGHP